MGSIVHFELPVKDPDRAMEFYTKVFGWKISKWEGPADYWLITTKKEGEPGVDGALMLEKDRDQKLGQGTINTVSVDDIDKSINDIQHSGGQILTQKMAIQGIGYHAYCRDTEGNVFGIMEDDPKAI